MNRLRQIASFTTTGWIVSACVLVFLAMVGAGPAEAGQAVATGARIGGDHARTRFVADLTEPVGFTVYVLPDPYRVFIDMPDVRFDLPPDAGHKTRGLVSEFRYGEVETGRSRIVIDTAGPVLIEKSFIVEAQSGQPARIVVDLVSTTEEAFKKAYQADEPRTAAAIANASAAEQKDRVSPDPQAEAGDPSSSGANSESATPPQDGNAPAVEAAAPSAGRRSDKRVVVIDPGHGGIDPGAIGVHKTREKDVVLAFGQELHDALAAKGGYEIIMTRSQDEFLSLKQRVAIAREHEADLFIAIHADTVSGAEARGATIYTLSEKASDAEADELARKENRTDIIAGIDLADENKAVTDILIDLAQRESKNHAMFFARKAVSEMKVVTSFTGKPLRSAGFVVLKAPDVPSVLIELGYLSSKHDEAQLTSPKWRSHVAKAMAGAIDKYFALQVASRAQ
jgi:N-acetylmuramoyl-L-alanine amidase